VDTSGLPYVVWWCDGGEQRFRPSRHLYYSTCVKNVKFREVIHDSAARDTDDYFR
jgi:hypothetical protein